MVWAVVEDCEVPLPDMEPSIYLSGNLAVVLSDGPVRAGTDVEFLTRFDFLIRSSGASVGVAGSFRYRPADTSLVIAFEVADLGRVLFFTQPGLAGFITADDRFVCDFVERSCVDSSGATLVF